MRYLETTRVDIATLEPFPGNARVHDEPALDESVEVNGQYRSVVARRLDGGLQLLAGHGTVNAFARRGDGDVRVEVIEADDTEARRIVLADNATSRNAGYDDALLLQLIDQASKDGGLPGTGWDDDDLKALLDSVDAGGPDLHGDPDDADVEPPAEPVTVPGDVWELGWHRLVCGDSTDEAAWGALLRDEKVDAVWTDPPYGVSYVGKTKDALTIKNDALTPAALRRLLDGAFQQALQHGIPGAAWYVAAPAGPLHLIFGNALMDLGIYRQQIIWAKDAFVLGHADYHYRHEPIFYGYAPGYTGRRGRGGTGWHSDHAQDTLWEIPRPKRSEDHPTMKPVELVGRALRNSTRGRALVADMFGGSGTTLIACEVEGRSGRLIELDPRYCDVIARRYQDLTGNVPVLERTGRRWDFTANPPCEEP